MDNFKKRYELLTGYFAIFMLSIFIITIILSVSLSPWFNLKENYLSDIAGIVGERPIWSARGPESIIFNIGIILTGISGMLFTFSLSKSIKKNMHNEFSNLLLYTEMFTLSATGIFPVTLGRIHVWSSFILFSLIPIVIILYGYSLSKKFGKNWLCISVFFTAISLFSVIIFVFNNSRSLSEIIALVSMITFFSFIGFKILNNQMEYNYSIKVYKRMISMIIIKFKL